MAYKNQKKNKKHIENIKFVRNIKRRGSEIKQSLCALIITWKRGVDHVSERPFVESFFTKSDVGAKGIIDRRRKDNMESAIYKGQDILKMK